MPSFVHVKVNQRLSRTVKIAAQEFQLKFMNLECSTLLIKKSYSSCYFTENKDDLQEKKDFRILQTMEQSLSNI